MKKILTFFALFFVLALGPSLALASDADPVSSADKAYFVSVRDAIIKNDKKWLASQINAPLLCDIKGKRTEVNKEQFLKHYDEIINAHVRKVVKEQDVEDLFKNSFGLMAGDGVLWIVQIADDDGNPKEDGYRIYTINNTPIDLSKL
ncbi:MAG: hypothetical protein PHX43_01340 [Alphaproteobacteria bacterium]|nr:hypothetical protein [Alphaproteobacteria bacterium]